jgi:hypothetical protein
MQALVAAIVTAVLATDAATQARPDFSGEWVIARANSGLLGEKFMARQDAKTLTLEISVAAIGRPVRVVYNLDGTESRNLNPSMTAGVADEPIFSRVSWDADKLVIQTRGSTLVNGKVQESKRVIWIDSEGLFTIERSSEGQPTTRSVYRRTNEPSRP